MSFLDGSSNELALIICNSGAVTNKLVEIHNLDLLKFSSTKSLGMSPVNRGGARYSGNRFKYGLPVNMGVANEPDVPQVPLNKGIPFVNYKQKIFLLKLFLHVIRSGINMLPGIRLIQGLDKFDTLPYQDRQFIKSKNGRRTCQVSM